jgi:O-antigen/teichoic acid export membrane protein
MLSILVWSDIFISLAVARYAYIMAMNWSWILLYTVLAGTLVNVVLNLVLIPLYGGIGAAVASFASYWVAAHLICYFFKPLRRTAQMMTRALINPKFW